MKLLIVGQYFWPESFRINEVAGALARAGCEVSVLTGPPNYPDGRVFPHYSAFSLRVLEKDGVRICHIPVVPRGNASGLRLALSYSSFVVSACRSVRGCCAAGGSTSCWCTRPDRSRNRAWASGSGGSRARRTSRGSRIFGRKVSSRRPLDLSPQPSAVGAVPLVRCAGQRDVRCYARCLYPNPGELSARGVPAAQAPALQLNAGFNVVFAGNLGRCKRWTSCCRQQNGRARTTIRQLTQVVLPGRFPPEAMPAIFAQASLLLVSLVRSPIMSQTVPSKVQAFLAAGRPIVAALDGEGVRVVIEAGAGLTVPAEDAAALSAAVLRLKAMTPGELGLLGEAGCSYYWQHFDADVLTRRLLECLREVDRVPSGKSMHAE